MSYSEKPNNLIKANCGDDTRTGPVKQVHVARGMFQLDAGSVFRYYGVLRASH